MQRITWLAALFLLILLGWISCATPSSPTGGPPDNEGPVIIETEPPTGTTNFSDQTIILHFSEFVNRSSLNQAIVVEPDIGISYGLDWGRKSVKIEFEEAIPDTTTLIITIGTEFQDMNGNSLESPQKIAVSTGPDIDEGQLLGRVINATSGEGTEGHRVLLYREPVDLTQQANYIASTDTGGVFRFSYLRQGKYKALWVDDRNRNKIWEPGQEQAQPFSQEYVQLAEAQTDTIGTINVTEPDTTFPQLQGVGLFSSQRMRMRFSENIQLTDSTRIAVTDTMGNFFASAFPLYIQPDEEFILFAHSEEPLSEESSYQIEMEGIIDHSGNAQQKSTPQFSGSAQEDTTQQRIITRNNLSGYFPSEPVEVIYAKPIEMPAVTDSLRIVEGDELIEDWPYLDVIHNKLRILPNEQWRDGVDYEMRIWDPIIEDTRSLQPNIWYSSQMGNLNIMAQDTTLQNIHLRVENEEAGVLRDSSFSHQVEISNLPPLEYKVTAFQDLNGNGEWDQGQVEPYVKPEPFFIQRNVPVKQAMTGDLTISFQQQD